MPVENKAGGLDIAGGEIVTPKAGFKQPEGPQKTRSSVKKLAIRE